MSSYRTDISRASLKYHKDFLFTFRINLTRFFRIKPKALVSENSFDPDIQVVTIKSHDNDVFYEISVIA